MAAGPGPGVHRPRISLVNADLTGLPPTSVDYGERELLVGDGAEFGRRLADFKVTSEVDPTPEGQHSFVVGAGRVPEMGQAIEQIGQWLRRHLGLSRRTAPRRSSPAARLLQRETGERTHV
ncbi:alpha/beta hydrolase [Nonomuraea sp. 3N208]|uniref:alpha/beta hydrolase n=1 Tax=Nonomuraea sp. 3N208 TaxID=3457421 RepID=UPI003FD30AF0